MVYIRSVEFGPHAIDHIARHSVSPDEVLDVCLGQPFGFRLRRPRIGVIGRTSAGRYLTIILERLGGGGYLLITAREATHSERRRYQRWR